MSHKNNCLLRRINGEPGRERKNSRALKVVRMVDAEDSIKIAGAIRHIVSDDMGFFPKMKEIPAVHPVYILDPRLVRKDLVQGFKLGIDWMDAQAKVNSRKSTNQPIDAKLGKLSLLGDNKRILAATIQSEVASNERLAIYGLLGEMGLSGFRRREHRPAPAPIAVLAKFDKPIRDPVHEAEILEAIETTLLVHQAMEITLGQARPSLH